MSSFSTYTETAVLNHLFRNVALPSPGSVRVALFTAAPTDAAGGTEVSGSGYARQPVTFGAPTADSGKMKISNSAAVTFTAAGGGIGPVVAVGVFDAATGGNLLAWSPITSATIGDGDSINFATGQIALTLA